MSKISVELEEEMRQNPARVFNLIVRTTGDAAPYVEWCEANELEVKREFRLSPGLAIAGRGEDALKLLEPEWVRSIELDATVRAM